MDINNKTFEEFILSAPTDEIPENVFIDIKFKWIKLMYSNFTRIHSNAFNCTSNYTEVYLHSPGNPSKLRNSPPDYDFYEAFSSLVNLKILYIRLDSDTVHEIPDYAFDKSNNQNTNLETINLWANSISRIGNYAFYNLLSIGVISINANSTQNISAHAFDFQFSSDTILSIELNGAQLDESCLESGVFQSPLRKIQLDLSNDLKNYF